MDRTLRELRALEGQDVFVTLSGGPRLDACYLISVSAGPDGTLWVIHEGNDRFVSLAKVAAVWPKGVIMGRAA